MAGKGKKKNQTTKTVQVVVKQPPTPKNTKKKKKRNKKARKAGVGMQMSSVQLPVASATTVGRAQRKIISRTADRMRLAHCEMISELTTTQTFSPLSFSIGFPNAALFPWSSTLSKQFEKYRLIRVNLFYVPSCGTARSGNVDITAQYDPVGTIPGSVVEMLQYEDKITVPVYQAGELVCQQRHLNQFKELWVALEGYSGGGSPRLNWAGNLYVSVTSGETPFVAGRLYVDYEVEFYEPVSNTASVNGDLVSDYYTAGNSTVASTVVLPPVLPTSGFGDHFNGGTMTFQNYNYASGPNGGASTLQTGRVVQITSPGDVTIEVDIDMDPAVTENSVFNYNGEFAWTTVFLVLDVGLNLISQLPAAYQQIVAGYGQISAGISLLKSAFTGKGPWFVGMQSAPAGTSETPVNFSASYTGCYIQLSNGVKDFSQFDAIVERQESLTTAGFMNGNCRVRAVCTGNEFIWPTLELEGVSLETQGYDLIMKNLKPGPYLVTTYVTGTSILNYTLSGTGFTLGTPQKVINSAGTAALVCVTAYCTSDEAQITLNPTFTTLTYMDFRLVPDVEYLFVSGVEYMKKRKALK